MTRIFPLLLAVLFFSLPSFGQEEISWKKHKKLADNLFEANQFVDAAEHYELAWKQHTKDEELIYKAGECYFLIKDFKKAIEAFQYVKGENDRFPLVGLKYGRALKQDGQYQAASDAFLYFISAYQGNDKSVLTSIVHTEIEGCEKAIELAKMDAKNDLEIRHLTENINSPAIEFAPIPYNDDLLYFSSTMKNNQATLFRSQRKGGEWKKAVIADGLPDFPKQHLANGSFAPNAKRFYFTLCDNSDGLSSKCEIYVLKREQSKWSTPIRLRDYINIDNASTTTQPWVVHQNGQEILYFSSDRDGGFGGLDIWYTTRDIDSDDMDFNYPVNAGHVINTIGDEITPFYDLRNKTLYYSSNGKVSLGGWDVFKAKGALENWATAENIGLPINSSADDFYYVAKPSGNGGFVVSNRLFGAEKISTQHEDIFEFGKPKGVSALYALGQVMDGETATPIKDVRISLYEVSGNRAKLLSSKKIAQSNYRFQVLPEKNLRLVVEKSGYLKNIYDFNTFKSNGSIDFTHVFNMNPRQAVTASPAVANTDQVVPNYSASTNRVNENIVENKNLTTSSPARQQNGGASSSATISIAPSTNSSGIHYKIQLIAVNSYNANHPRYNKIKNINRIETERLATKKVTRVLLADFSTRTEAEQIKNEVRGYGFTDAFVVKYKDGKRIGRLW